MNDPKRELAWFIFAYMATNVLSYLFIVVAGRNLLPNDYGLLTVFLGLLNLAAVFSNAIQASAARSIASHRADISRASIFKASCRVAGAAAVVSVAVLLPFASRLHATPELLVAWAFSVFTMVSAAGLTGAVTGLGHARIQVDLPLYATAARALAGVCLLPLGFGVGGAMAAFALHYGLLLALSWNQGRRIDVIAHPQKTPVGQPKSVSIDMPTVLLFSLTFMPFSLDQFLVQSLIPEHGGSYAAIGTLSKLVFFTCTPVIAFCYPRFLNASDEVLATTLMRRGLAAIAGCAFGLVLGLYFTGDLLMKLFFAGKYSEAGPFIVTAGVGAAFFSITLLATYAQMRWHETRRQVMQSLIVVTGGALLHITSTHDLHTAIRNQLIVLVLQCLLTGADLTRSGRDAARRAREAAGN